MISLANGKRSQQTCLNALSLAPPFFNICINDFFLFIEITTVCNYVGDNSMYSSDTIIPEWFYKKYMVLNADELSPDFSFNDTAIATEEKILGIVS